MIFRGFRSVSQIFGLGDDPIGANLFQSHTGARGIIAIGVGRLNEQFLAGGRPKKKVRQVSVAPITWNARSSRGRLPRGCQVLQKRAPVLDAR